MNHVRHPPHHPTMNPLRYSHALLRVWLRAGTRLNLVQLLSAAADVRRAERG